jgi:hypothetical protein
MKPERARAALRKEKSMRSCETVEMAWRDMVEEE